MTHTHTHVCIYIYTYIDLNFSDSLPSFRIPVFATFTVIVPMLQACPPAQDLSIHNTHSCRSCCLIRSSTFGEASSPGLVVLVSPKVCNAGILLKWNIHIGLAENETFHSIFVPDATRGHVCIFQHGISTAAVCQSWYNVSDLCGHHRVQTLASRSWSWIVIVLPDRSSAAVSILIIRDFPIRWFCPCIVSRRITRGCLEQQTEKRNRNGYKNVQNLKTFSIYLL